MKLLARDVKTLQG